MMKLYMILNYILILFICFKIKFSLGENPNYAQLIERISNDIQAFKTLKTITNNTVEEVSLDNIVLNDIYVFNSLSDVHNSSSKEKCLLDLLYVAENLKSKSLDIQSLWAWQMLDANGKLESGIFEGNLRWLGDFVECKKVYAPKHNNSDMGDFHGQYCNLNIHFGNISYPVSLGLCLPDTCNSSDLIHDYKKLLNITKSIPFFNKFDLEIRPDSLTCKPNERKLTNAAIITMFVLSVFLLLASLGSFVTAVKHLRSSKKCNNSFHGDNVTINYDSDVQDEDDVFILTDESRTKLSVFFEKCDSFLNCFCIFTNGAKLLNTETTEDQLLCIHGIRFLSMSWVIVGHTYAFSLIAARNIAGAMELIDNWPFQIILNGSFSVDSFFVLSAFLVSYLYFQKADEGKGNFSWLYFYIHRYLRLTPVYMLVIGFYTTIFISLGTGPFAPDYDIEPLCQKSWWWNILYINNFQNTSDACLGWSWYLSNDMQFFVISPIFLVTLWRWPKIGFSILTLFFCGTWIATFMICYQNNLSIGLIDVSKVTNVEDYLAEWSKYFDNYYTKPYTRIGPYLVGIILGYILFKAQYRSSNTNIVIRLWGWIFAALILFECVFGTYHKDLNLIAASFYNSLGRTGFALSLSWIIYVCITEQGGVVNKILSFKLFIPLSRLTYCAYLIHPLILIGYYMTLKTTIEFTHFTMVIIFLGALVATYSISLFVSLIFESPVIRLDKLIRNN